MTPLPASSRPLTSAIYTIEEDEVMVANDTDSLKMSSLGPPPECTYASSNYSAPSAKFDILPFHCPRPDFVGGRLGSLAGRKCWNQFFGPEGPASNFFCPTAQRIAAGWSPEYVQNPVQERRQVPRLRPPTSDPAMLHAEQALLREQLSKRIIEVIPSQEVVPLQDPLKADRKMIFVSGCPFPVPRTVYLWLHDVFIVPKAAKGKWRQILQGRPLNEYFVHHSFKSSAETEATAMLQHLMYMLSYDVQDFFPHVKILKRYRNNFAFRVVLDGKLQYFRFRGLPFGIHDSPRALELIMKPIKAYLHGAHSIRQVQHVDDGLIAAQTPAQARHSGLITLKVLVLLYFLVSWGKCRLRPARRRTFMGMIHDTESMVRRLTVPRLKSVTRGAKQLIGCLTSGRPISLRLLASTLGRERAARQCVPVTYLMTREIMRWQQAALLIQIQSLGVSTSRLPIFDDETVVRPTRAYYSSRKDRRRLAQKILMGVFRPSTRRRAPCEHLSHWAVLVDWDQDIRSTLPTRYLVENTPSLLAEQKFWANEIPLWNGRPMDLSDPVTTNLTTLSMDTDASGFGGGAVYPQLPKESEVRFHWTGSEIPRSINWKELATPGLSLHALETAGGMSTPASSSLPCANDSSHANPISTRTLKRPAPPVLSEGLPVHGGLPRRVRRRLVQLRTDNTATVAYIRHQGGPLRTLSVLAEALWKWLLRRGCWIQVSHLAGILNVAADAASRWLDDRSEWRLSRQAFQQVQDRFGPHSIDLFASRRNTMLPRFFSRYLDPSAAAHDAFRQDWAVERNAYAHPPYILIPRILEKVRRDKATITLVAPLWAAQSWMVDLIELSVQLPQILVAKTLVEPAVPQRWVPTQPSWATCVWRISGSDLSSTPKTSLAELRTVLSLNTTLDS